MKQIIKRLLRRCGYEVSRYSSPVTSQPTFIFPQIDVLDLAIHRETTPGREWFFIQIGAHDGVSFDPIHRYICQHHWRGIVVEPQPKLFSRLVSTYEGEPQLILENVAIGTTDGRATLYAFKENTGLPYHATMLASFSRAALEHNGHGYKGEIEELTVPTLCVRSLLSKHDVSHVDLLQIDTEGFDKAIIDMFIEADCWPTIIHFEDACGLREKNAPFYQPLIDKGYAFFHLWPDTLCYRQTADAEFRCRVTATQQDFDAFGSPPA